MITTHSESLYKQACLVTPGGVNSPVRSFQGVGGHPLFIQKGQGPYCFDVDGNRFVDYMLSWGPLVLGHAHPQVIQAVQQASQHGLGFGAPTALEVQLAQVLVKQFDCIDQIRFVSTGTEATMSAIRLARAYTKRSLVVKFSGCYHGHADCLLAQAGSGVATLSLPGCAGVPTNSVQNTLIVPFNDLQTLQQLFVKHSSAIACVIVEGIAANMGFVFPRSDFLMGIQQLCQQHNALFVLDEVMTGFRAAIPGLAAKWQLEPDLLTLGKVIGGGLPCAAYGGKQAIMQHVAPVGNMYQAGTLSGNPLAMAAGLATLQECCKPTVFATMAQRAQHLVTGICQLANKHDLPVQANSQGSMFGLYFLRSQPAQQPIKDWASVQQHVDTKRYARFFHFMLQHGFYFPPSAYEACFVSSQHTSQHVQETLLAFGEFLEQDKTRQ
ncbi:MAG: glutamate-1-semialdehyde 2,1-aminomutase [Myxococcota bacterium]